MGTKTYIIGNWKMHCSPAEASLLVNRLVKDVTRVASDTVVVLCPPVLDLTTVQAELRGHDRFAIGVQNIYPMDEGAFTGEVSAAMVKDLADYAIIGHSERRHVFHERDGLISQKVSACLRNGIRPILCVGETQSEHAAGHTKQVVFDQLDAGTSLLTEEELESLIIAYEPVWAIGTGENAEPKAVAEILAVIRGWFATKYSKATSEAMPILYGGSVKGANAKMYLDLTDCNGCLVGGASTNYKDFAKIVDAAN